MRKERKDILKIREQFRELKSKKDLAELLSEAKNMLYGKETKPITFRNLINYTDSKFSNDINMDVDEAVEYLETFEGAIESAAWYWYNNGLNEMAEDPKIHNMKVKVQVVGRLEMLPDDVRNAISNIEEKTAKYSNFLFTVCLAYGGREEIVDAVRKVADEHSKGEIKLEEIDTNKISSKLYTANLPDPDLVIRTSGEERISNFLLWQIAYSELHFTDVHWPSFGKQDLYEAIESYQRRKRRYGS